MDIALGAALLGGGILLFWCTMIGTRLARPPRWTGDTMVACLIAPLVLFTITAGAGLLVYTAINAGWHALTPAALVEFAIVLAVCVGLGLSLARWSRRSPRKAAAEVITLPLPETPQPPRPAPQLGTPRKAA